METFVYSILATFLVSLVSFVGIIVLFKNFFSQKKIITALIAFSAGALLGDVFFHLLPDYLSENTYSVESGILVLSGLMVMFCIEAYLHCAHEDIDSENDKKRFVIGRMGVLGDVIHNFLDGVAIAVSFVTSFQTGLLTTFAIIFHEIPKEISNVSLLSFTGWKRSKILLVNFATALSSIAGAILTFIVLDLAQTSEKFLIPFIVGQFLYIALADLLPEIHKKSGMFKYLVEIFMFVSGVVLMYLIKFIEL